MHISSLISVAAIGLSSIAGAAEPEPKPGLQVCSARESGDPERFLVGTAKTAKDIFTAVERDYFPYADKKNFPDVRVRDEGSYWSVFRHRDSSRDRPKEGEIILHFAGHQLSMHIDKCTGTISNVYFMR